MPRSLARQHVMLASRGLGREFRRRSISRRWLRARWRSRRLVLALLSACSHIESLGVVMLRSIATTGMELAGFALIVAGLWAVSVPVAAIVAGALMVTVGAWQGRA